MNETSKIFSIIAYYLSEDDMKAVNHLNTKTEPKLDYYLEGSNLIIGTNII